MALTCGKCSRINPPDAAYCYFDGVALNGHGAAGTVGAKRTFPTPFVFPSGRSCGTFDELAIACQENWKEACSLLEQGFFARFFAALGRTDLAVAAREAGRFPDRERGLDQLLCQLPTDVLDQPKLQVEPQEVNLGTLAVGQDRRLSFHLENLGQRLLYGTITIEDCPWLVLGDGEGAAQKVFQFRAEMTVPVQVRGQRLRASAKPLEGRLVIESNGGNFMVVVTAQVPVRPFTEGLFSGSVTPRQIAEKAKAQPKEAAPLFEKGAVAAWYKANGWTYPVQVPSASGIGAVQQFFEALGLTAPPRVEISEQAVRFEADPGASLRHKLEVRTQEKRPVWAHAASDQPWLEVSRAKLNGRTATIGFSIPSVPGRPGETLTAHVTVTANGNQRFVVTISVVVGGDFAFTPAPMAIPIDMPTPAEGPIPVRSVRQGTPPWLHALPALVLALILFGVLFRDGGVLFSNKPDTGEPPPSAAQAFNEKGNLDQPGWFRNLHDHKQYIGISYDDETTRFGLVALNPDNVRDVKKLTSDEKGRNNNTCLRINGFDYLFGLRPGKLLTVKKLGSNPKRQEPPTWETVWEVNQKYHVRVTQTVMLVPGDDQKLNTCLVRYKVENLTEFRIEVGLRFMLDTFIGTEDGVPFSVPGRQPPLVTKKAILAKQDIPDYIQALEHPDLQNPGTVAQLGLKGIRLPDSELEPVTEVVICRWPLERGPEVRWSWDYEDMDKEPDRKDSCVVLIWAPHEMNPGEVREMAFTYGLGQISSAFGEKAGQLALYAPGSVRPGDQFTVTAFAKSPKMTEPMQLKLPEGLVLADDKETADKPVPAEGQYGQVSWRVKAVKEGKYDLEVEHGGATAKRPLTVSEKKRTLFD